MESNRNRKSLCPIAILVLSLCAIVPAQATKRQKSTVESFQEKTIGVSVNTADGAYSIFDPDSKKPILRSRVAAEVNHRWLRSTDYPKHTLARQSITDELGPATELTVSNSGLAPHPDLIYSLKLRADPPSATITVTVHNAGSTAVTVQDFRSVEAIGPYVDLAGPDASDRVLSDSWSEDRPGITIHDLADAAAGMHRGVGSQLIYNRDSKRSLFLGALASEKFLTILHLHVDNNRISAYEVDCTGTTELTKENSLRESAPEDQIELSVPVSADADLSSEPLLISIGTDYHQQLEAYGRIIRQLHHARVNAPSIAGWWSWTAYYFGLNQATALTNAEWLSQNLKDFGYQYFHIDEGYQFARGEYTTPDVVLFPDGVKHLEAEVRALGLTPGIWTAPFEVSERSWVYEKHKDWLVHNAGGEPIRAGYVIGGERRLDPLYVLDGTNPGAQDYLRRTYQTLRDWGIRYIKLDFMEDSAIEGFYYKPNTTALEAQRIGLRVIRDAVGESVLLDKDGSPMLNPVGIVDMGRTSVDTGHKFEASKEAAPGIAARYYMHRNFFVADPDAFTVSRQTVDEQAWHGGKHPLSLDEARVSIVLSAVSGGMYEVGDDLPTLGADPERLALVKNTDLLNMARLGQASRPLDLMSYAPEDGMPSTFLLHESKRIAMLTVFNWTDKPRERKLDLAQDLGLQLQGGNQVFDVLDTNTPVVNNPKSLVLQLPPHSVKVLKIVDAAIPPTPPAVTVNVPDHAQVGEAIEFSADPDSAGTPALAYHWDFGDGTRSDGRSTTHAYTHAGEFTLRLTADGLDGLPFEKAISLKIEGKIDTRFYPANKKRGSSTQ
jgi:hypothetical protein